MTVATTTNREQYATDGVTTVFTVHFPFFDDADVNAIFVDTGGAATTLVLSTDFSVSGGNGAGGTLTTTAAPDSGGALTIFRDIPFTQEDDYVENDPLPADTLESGFDRAAMRDQQLLDAQSRSLTFPPTIDPAVSAELPNPTGDTYLGWNSAGDALENKTLPPGTAVYSSVTNTMIGTATAEAVTPAGLAVLWADGGNVNAGANIPIGAGGSFNLITSTTAITGFVFSPSARGRKARVRFSTVRTLTNSAALTLPGGANIVTADGDTCEIEDRGSGNVRVNQYTRVNGNPLTVAGMAISGGTIDGAIIGGTTPAVVTGTTFRSFSINIADDHAVGFVPPQVAGKVMVTSAGVSPSGMGEAFFNTGSATSLLAGTVGSIFDVSLTNDVLNGVTGTDGHVTLRAYSGDGKIYLENRTGATRTFIITIIG